MLNPLNCCTTLDRQRVQLCQTSRREDEDIVEWTAASMYSGTFCDALSGGAQEGPAYVGHSYWK